MAYKKTKSFIDTLNNILHESYHSYFIWKFLYCTHTKIKGESVGEDKIEIFNKYKSFFKRTENAHQKIFLLGISKFFDNNKNNKPVSINSTKNYIQSNQKKITAEEFKKNNHDRPFIDALCENYEGIKNRHILDIDQILIKNKYIIEKIRKLRDKRIAHEDKNEIEKVIPAFKKIEALFDDMIKMVNILSYGLEHNSTSYSHIKYSINQDMYKIFEKLNKE